MDHKYTPQEITDMLFSPELFTDHNKLQLASILREDPFQYLFELFERSDTNSSYVTNYKSITVDDKGGYHKLQSYRTVLTQDRIEGFISIDDERFAIQADRHGNFVCSKLEVARGYTTTLSYAGMPWIEITKLEGFLTSSDSLDHFPEKASDTLTELIMTLDEKGELEAVLTATPYKKLSSSWENKPAVLLENSNLEKILVTSKGVSLPKLKTSESFSGVSFEDSEKYVKHFSDFTEELN